MKIFLSSLENGAQVTGDKKELAVYLSEKGIKFKWNLMSYYYLRNKFALAEYIRDRSEEIEIDSGAHSFQKGKRVDWEQYTKEYAAFIREFYGVFPFDECISIALCTCVVETIIGLMDTPFVYLGRRVCK